MTAGILRAAQLSVDGGLPDALLNAFRVDTTRPVRDAEDRVLATVRQIRRRGPLHVVHRFAGWLVPLIAPSRDWEVADAGGVPWLRVRAFHNYVLVLGPSGEQLGSATNVSRLSGPPDLAVEVHAGNGRPRRGTPVASFRGRADQNDFDYELHSPGGVVGRLRHGGGTRFVLEPRPEIDDEVRTLLVGLLCGLVDRRWWRLPHRETT